MAGTTLLTGANGAFLGKTTVSGGRLVVLGQLGGAAEVTGGTLQYGDGGVGAANRVAADLKVSGAGSTLALHAQGHQAAGQQAQHQDQQAVDRQHAALAAGGRHRGGIGRRLVEVHDLDHAQVVERADQREQHRDHGQRDVTGADPHTQNLFGDWQLGLRAGFQLSSGALVSNEQFSAGGSTSVRGYLAAERTGDDGFLGSVEWRTPSLARWLGSNVNEWWHRLAR
ncbi:ShlB/FhaC/HecB family hemolysin secretion/activation protein [Lactiplantibacillus plantarum]|uniref:ShlB/FhaC/HecB family hemolysin secretion/activation protein n=1 Tax=Lactiplantibacillus plantarum TaxID=1590 RepID=UPI004045BBC0